jgi:hypothetical protein
MKAYIHHWFTGKNGGIRQNQTGLWVNCSDGFVADIVHKFDVVIDNVEIVGLYSLEEAVKRARELGAEEYWNGQRFVKL